MDLKKVVKPAKEKKKGNKAKHGLGIVIIIVLVAVAILALLVNFITDLMWFSEMDYVSVFLTKLVTMLKIGIPLVIVLFLLLDVYLTRLRVKYFRTIDSAEATDMKKLARYTRIVAVIFSVVITIPTVRDIWYKALQFFNSTEVGIKDPIFDLDISFYLFKLDFLQSINNILIGVIAAFIVMTVIYYAILLKMHTPRFFEKDYTKGGGESVHPEQVSARRLDRDNLRDLAHLGRGQISILGVVLFLMIGLEFFLRQFDLLHAHTGTVYGAGFTDVNIRLWVYRVLMALSIASAVLFVVFMRKRRYKKLLYGPGLMIAVGIVGMIVAAIVQNLIVAPDELNKEEKYLARNIEFTQYAYQLDDVSVREFSASNDLTGADIAANSQTVSNIRINDYDPVNTFYNQTQSIRQYYSFNDADVDRYMIGGKLTQTYLSPREIDESKISSTWINKHIKYTHGYGVAISKVNEVTASGQPDVVVKNIPPESQYPELEIEQPRIYFGEMTDDYSLVNTKEDEFDYPDGTENKYTTYEGTAGIKLNFFARLMFALRERSLKLLVSTNITGESRILIYRNVEDRVNKIMPYLDYETDPYMVTVDGKLYWIIDAYTTSSNYPYSEPLNGEEDTANYIRNSVKVVIDAYNGDVTYYIVDETDPIAKTYQKIYPKLFKDYDEMPDGLKEHIRYPNDLFEMQARIYSRYHMNNVRVFYQDEDRWDIASEIYGMEQQTMTANYYIVNLPGEDHAEFINSISYTPKSKQNMTALMVARNDGEHYGELVLYQFPKSKTVYGPMQVEAQIDQNTEISADFSLWNSAGSKYSRGNLFVIPINDSLLYVEPVYLEASNSAIPEVKRVIVVYGDRIAYAPTLGDALTELFGNSGGTDTSGRSSGGNSGGSKSKTQKDYITGAQNAYDKAQDALKDGDWAAYGKYMDELKDNLDHLE